MAIREDDVGRLLEGRPDALVVPTGNGMAVDLGDHAGAAARARRHVLRRLLIADVVGLAMAALLGPLVISSVSTNPSSTAERSGSVVLFDLAVIPLFLGVFAVYGLYRGATRRISMSVFSDLRNILHALMVSGFLYAVLGYVAQNAYSYQAMTVGKILAMCLLAAVTVPLARIVAFGLLGRGSAGSVPVIVVGTGKLAQTVASHLRAHSSVKFVGFVDDSPLGRSDLLGELEDLPDLCRRFDVARVVVCFSRTHPERTTEMLKALSGKVGVSIVPRYYELITSRSHVEDLSGLPMIDIAPASLSAGSRFLKRTLDVVVSSVILVLISPFFLVTAILIKATSPGPVFFRQVRTGRNEWPFSVLKFRTMYEDAEQRKSEILHLNEVDGPLFKVTEDPRRHAARPLPAPHQPRRAASAHQRVEGRHVAGRSPSLRRLRVRRDRGLGPQAVRGPSRNDRALAGVGPQRAVTPGTLPTRLPLRGIVVVLVGHADPVADSGHDLQGAGRLLSVVGHVLSARDRCRVSG